MKSKEDRKRPIYVISGGYVLIQTSLLPLYFIKWSIGGEHTLPLPITIALLPTFICVVLLLLMLVAGNITHILTKGIDDANTGD